MSKNKNLRVELKCDEDFPFKSIYRIELKNAWMISEDENGKMIWVATENLIIFWSDYKEIASDKSKYISAEFKFDSLSWVTKHEIKFEELKDEFENVYFHSNSKNYINIGSNLTIKMKMYTSNLFNLNNSKINKSTLQVHFDSTKFDSVQLQKYIENSFNSQSKLDFIFECGEECSILKNSWHSFENNSDMEATPLNYYVNYFMKSNRIIRLKTNRDTKIDKCVGLDNLKEIVSKTQGNIS